MIDLSAFTNEQSPVLHDRAGALCAAVVLLTKNRIAIISEADEPAIAGYSWCFNNGYAARCVARPLNEREVRGRQKMIFMHRVILRIEDGFEVDHINRFRHDNRRSNMRVATSQQNTRNTAPPNTNKSGFKGVHWCKQDKKWKAAIRVDGRKLHLGYHLTSESAAKAYDKAAAIHFGEFAVLNFPSADGNVDAAGRVTPVEDDDQ
jgi:hypothetical protein